MNIVVRMATMADAAVLAGLYGALDYPAPSRKCRSDSDVW